MTDQQQQPSFAQLRAEAEALGIIKPEDATQTKEQLAQAITAARIKQAIQNRGGGR